MSQYVKGKNIPNFRVSVGDANRIVHITQIHIRHQTLKIAVIEEV